MNQAERYFQLSLLGRDAFLESAAPAALVRSRAPGGPRTELDELTEEDTLVAGLDGVMAKTAPSGGAFEVYPLAKKPGAPFADMITVGRTDNNDVVIKDVTVSRFHAFFRERDGAWIVCDAGSKNGTSVDDARLEARKEHAVSTGTSVRVGDIDTTFYTAEQLYEYLARNRG